MPTDIADVLPLAKDCKRKVALAEAERAMQEMQRRAAVELEKRALLEHLTKPSGVSDEERVKRCATIIKQAVDNGHTEIEIGRFPNQLSSDRGRAINQLEPGWEKTLTGIPREVFEFWQRYLKPRGYRLKAQIVDFPGGMPGDFGLTLSWD